MHSLVPSADSPLSILCIGAHCDDIEIGCGGSLLRLIEEGRVGRVDWVVMTGTEQRKKEAEATARQFLQGVGEVQIEVLAFPDTRLAMHAEAVKDYFSGLQQRLNPDLIFTHFRHDRHQDHRFLAELSWNTFRNHLILEYEIPKYDGDLGQPNYFIHLSQEQAQRKVALILAGFQSQADKHWFDQETFLALLRIRGLESAARERYAEAYHVRKASMCL